MITPTGVTLNRRGKWILRIEKEKHRTECHNYYLSICFFIMELKNKYDIWDIEKDTFFPQLMILCIFTLSWYLDKNYSFTFNYQPRILINQWKINAEVKSSKKISAIYQLRKCFIRNDLNTKKSVHNLRNSPTKYITRMNSWLVRGGVLDAVDEYINS